jgi:hypothetical protein
MGKARRGVEMQKNVEGLGKKRERKGMTHGVEM